MIGTTPPRCVRALVLSILGLILCQTAARPACAIEMIRVDEMRWGFSGKVALNRFNVLSVLVSNPSPQPFEGNLVLRKTLGGAGYVDARIIEPVTLAPLSSRWVQFYPYINSGWGNSVGNETWELSWGRERFEVPVPRVAKYQRAILDDPNGVSSRSSVLRPMPENLFPAFVTATDALQVLAMDREPRTWIPAQKEAFLDWLHLGGTVLLMPGPTGRIPEFAAPLSVLNSPLDDFRYGSGRVIKSSVPRAQFNIEIARQMFAALPKNYTPPKRAGDGDSDPADPIDEVDPGMQAQLNIGNNQFGEGVDPFVSGSFLSQLKEMTKPEHNWVLLHLMFWVYISMVFPGCYLLGKRWSDFRVVYGGLLGTVALFSFLFSVVGQRGYGESTAVHSVAISRALADGGQDVSAWSNVFVTGGADYTIKHNARGVLYSTCSETEQVNGLINNGADADFVVDIPPFSNREMAIRMRLPAGSPQVKVESFKNTEGRLTDLLMRVDGLPSNDARGYALYVDRFYSVNRQNDGTWKLTSDSGDVAAMLNLQNMQHWSSNSQYGYNPYGQPVATVQDRYQSMLTPLLSRSLSVAREFDVRQVRLPADTVRVFFYTKMPADFAVQNDRLGAQEGQVLYCIDVPLKE